MSKDQIIIICILLLALGGFLVYQNPPRTWLKTTADQTVSPQLTVSDQSAAPFVIVQRAIMTSGGFVTIHQSLGTSLGVQIGVSAYAEAGYNDGLVAVLAEPSRVGQSLIAVLHQDNGDKQFNAADDPAVIGVDGQPVEARFLILDQVLLDASGF